MRRMTRLTNAFSKKWANLEAACGLWFPYYSFCWMHAKLRVRPVTESGLTNHVWTLAELICANDFKTKKGPSQMGLEVKAILMGTLQSLRAQIVYLGNLHDAFSTLFDAVAREIVRLPRLTGPHGLLLLSGPLSFCFFASFGTCFQRLVGLGNALQAPFAARQLGFSTGLFAEERVVFTGGGDVWY